MTNTFAPVANLLCHLICFVLWLAVLPLAVLFGVAMAAIGLDVQWSYDFGYKFFGKTA